MHTTIITYAKTEKQAKAEWYQHTGNSKYGRRGLHKRLRQEAKRKIGREF